MARGNDLYSRRTQRNFFDDEDLPQASAAAAAPSRVPHSQSAYSFGPARQNPSNNPFELDDTEKDETDELGSLNAQIGSSKNRQLESQRRALTAIYESESSGFNTVEELSRQGEKLDNVEGKLDGMNSTLTQTQRNLNNIKSIFGGIKNWWGGGKPADPKKRPTSSQSAKGDIKTEKEPEKVQKDTRNHPHAAANKAKERIAQRHYDDPYERELNDNLGEMQTGVGRLRQLALDLGSEMDRQNKQIDRLQHKTDIVNPKIKSQQRQMDIIMK